jgi:PAS domain S-box-containing protein
MRVQVRQHERPAGPAGVPGLRALIEAAPDAVVIMDAAGRILEWNSQAQVIFGWSRDEAIGQALTALVIPANSGTGEGETLRTMVASRTPELLDKRLELVAVRRDGSRFPAEVSLARLWSDGNEFLTAFARDVSDRKWAEQALRRSEHLYRSLVAAAASIVWTADAKGGFRAPQSSWEAYTGQNWDAHRGFGWVKAYHPEDRARMGEGWDNATTLRRPYAFEGRLWHQQSQQYRYVLERGVPILEPDGTIGEWAGTVMDVHERRRAEEAYKEESRTLELLNRVGTTLVSELDLDRLVQSATNAARELCGAEIGAFLSKPDEERSDADALFALSAAPPDASAGFAMLRAAALFELTFGGRAIVRSDDIGQDPRYGRNPPQREQPAVRSFLAVPVVSRSGEPLGGLFFGHGTPGAFTERAERVVAGIAAQAAVAIDNARLYQAAQREIAQRTRVEEHQKLLLAELNHRVKNTLAVVLAIASQTLRGSTSLEAFDRAFQGRLRTLARAHTLLTQHNWEATTLEALVREAFAPYPLSEGDRVAIHGPHVSLRPRAALTLSLVLHELTTNALKHGALSAPAGRVAVEWRILEGEARVQFAWTETAGPAVAPVSRRGFGSMLIERNVTHELGAELETEYLPDGFRCRILLRWDPETREVALAVPWPEPEAPDAD